MKPDSIYNLIQELKRRRVFRGVVVYGASTLILLEAAQNISNMFGLESAPTWFGLLLGIGFLISLWFSWIYDFTPGGIKKTKPDLDHKVPIPRKEVRTYQTTTFVSVIIIIGLLSYNIIDGANKKKIQRLDKSIAVLPLDDTELSHDESQHFSFVGHEITSCLLKVKEYRVVPWEDCRKYKRGEKLYPEIGMDLSAAILVDWTPYATDIHKHLSVNLISANDGNLLMSESFDIEGNWSDQICKHSRKISKMITRKLRTYLTPQERALIDEQPTSSQASFLVSLGSAMTKDTWEMIQTGNVAADKEKGEYIDSLSFDRAIKYFTEAIKEDPTFAVPYANRAKAKLWGMKAGFYDKTVLEASRKDIEKAFDLDKNLPEAHVAMGFYHYFGNREYQWALISFEKAIELMPNNNEYLFNLSSIHGTLGNWDEVRNYCNMVFNSNPRNVLFLTNLGISYFYLGDFSRSIVCQDRAIELNPNWYAPYINKILSLISTGNIKDARKVLQKVKENTDKNYYRLDAELDLYAGDYSSALEDIELAKQAEFIDLGESEGDAYLLKARIYTHAGIDGKAREYYHKAVDYFNNRIMFNSKDYFAYSRLGFAYAGIGMNQLAIENGQKGLELGKKQYSAILYPFIMYDMALTYTLIGNHESAMNILKELLDTNSLYTSEFIKLDPDMKILLDDPGFEFVNL